MAEASDQNSQCSVINQTGVLDTKISHKRKKALLMKQKRKLKRQAIAKEQASKLQQEEEMQKKCPGYIARLQREEQQMEALILQMEDESRRQRELWEWSEEIYKEKLKQKKEQEERERLNRLEIERKIKEEWEERQKKEKEEEEQKKKKKEKQEELLRQARQGENKDADWHNPLAPVQYGQERVVNPCPFFAKVGACRFGDRCSRAHPYPDTGRTILFTAMFRHFQLDQGLCEEYDTDIVLEYEDSEVYQKFAEFYEDTLPEFKASGKVTQFKVCCNFQPHLRGNVYVSYAKEDEALQAYSQFNARWYGGKQLTACFVEIPSWKRAICGLFGRGRCPKGKECNFLHVFKNPTNEFSFADKDMEKFTPRDRNDRHTNRFDKHSYSTDRSRKRSKSRSPSRSYRKHRSRSSEKYSRSRRSHSRDRKYKSKYNNRSRSRYSRSSSRDRYRSRSNSRDRGHSRSEAARRSRSRSRERSRYSSKKRSQSRDRTKASKYKHSKSKSRSPSRNRHEQKRKRHKERPKSQKGSSDDSDYEEVWVEKTR